MSQQQGRSRRARRIQPSGGYATAAVHVKNVRIYPGAGIVLRSYSPG
eukprot:SAG31_NODE_46895_length_252_cov_1.013072_1_plen_46_part_01